MKSSLLAVPLISMLSVNAARFPNSLDPQVTGPTLITSGSDIQSVCPWA